MYDILLHKLEKDKHAVVLYKGTVKVGEFVPLAPCAPCPSIFLFQFDILFQIIVAVSEVLDGMTEVQRDFVIVRICQKLIYFLSQILSWFKLVI